MYGGGKGQMTTARETAVAAVREIVEKLEMALTACTAARDRQRLLENAADAIVDILAERYRLR
jgi:hypothetical protein